MAELMVGGAILGAVFNVLVKKMISPQVVDFFGRKKLNHELLEKLEWKLNAIAPVLDDAEQKQITQPSVKKWLGGLKNAAYEAEYLLDEIAYYAMQMEVEAQGQSNTDQKRKFPSSLIPLKFQSRPIPHRRRLQKRLKEILKTLDLLQQMAPLGLEKDVGVKHYTQIRTSLVDESGVYGRDKDKDAIIELLLSDDENSTCPTVIPIVGMGGVGKTTLAQLVYNDNRVKEQFELRAWVCVSEEMDFRKLTKDILKEMGFSSCDTMGDNGLHCKLEEELKEKRVLLVLDDVWSDNQEEWESCLIPFKSVKGGSKIIVTTRSERVASVKSTVPTYHLQQLSEDDCWSLFVRHAFSGGSSSVDQDLIVIGKKLVEKCKGLPLAAKTLGSQLHGNNDVEDWERMLRSNLWDLKDEKILPALRLSYYYLPSYLKQCFAYCALFPKDYEFQKERLILLWMAEGFIVQPKGNKEMAEMGDDYFLELISRSFFQPSSTDSSSFIMHDLMHDLAESIWGEFCLRLEDDQSGKPSKTTRHLSIRKDLLEANEKLEGVHEGHGLRTFLLLSKFPPQYVLDFAGKLRCLRVLSLRWMYHLTELPDSIGKLKHLRYLEITEASIARLPEAVSFLYNLQTLILRNCGELGELPNSIGDLKQLQYLDLAGSPIQSLPESISSVCNLQKLILSGDNSYYLKLNAMPSDMGKLIKLKKLTDYVVGKRSGSGIKELGKLQELHETLRIWNLENVQEAQSDLGAILMGTKYLKQLDLNWKGFAWNSEYVLEQLKPHTNLKILSIDGYGGASFPNWIGASSFSHMVSLDLTTCENCTSFPPLGQLESLKELYIAEFPSVEIVGLEFYGSCTKKPFKALESLTIREMKNWKEWISEADKYEGSAFPSLQELVIEKCPFLTKALPTHLPSLMRLYIRDCENCVLSWPSSSALLEMIIEDRSRYLKLEKTPSGLHRLLVGKSITEFLNILGSTNASCIAEEIEITKCYSLKSFPLDLFPNLKALIIDNCADLESLCAREILPCLNSLKIRRCRDLKSLPAFTLFPFLEDLDIEGCPELELFQEGSLPLPPKLKSLRITFSHKLFACRQNWNLQKLPSLSRLMIWNASLSYWDDLESFPEKILLPSSLTSLVIWNLQDLKTLDSEQLQCFTPYLTSLTLTDLPSLESLNYEWFHKLTSLKQLKIDSCNMLESIPEDGLPSSLTSLELKRLMRLESPECKWLQQLSSLEELRICQCRKLQSFPEKGLPSSLSFLDVADCPLLQERCARERGEDWPKISHIRRIRI